MITRDYLPRASYQILGRNPFDVFDICNRRMENEIDDIEAICRVGLDVRGPHSLRKVWSLELATLAYQRSTFRASNKQL